MSLIYTGGGLIDKQPGRCPSCGMAYIPRPQRRSAMTIGMLWGGKAVRGNMSQTGKVQGRATAIFTADGITHIIYHSTAVVKFDADKVILNSGGWRTVTTKLRMNQTANQYGLGFQVYQDQKEWFVSYRGETIPFEDQMILSRS